MSCDFMPNDTQIVATSINGEISIFCTNRQKRTFYHDTIPELMAQDKENRLPPEAQETLQPDPRKKAVRDNREDFSNIMYCCKTVKGPEGSDPQFLVGCEDKNILKINIDYANVDVIDKFAGHSSGIRSIQLSRDGQKLISGCEDHSLRIWDYNNCKAQSILSGHKDVVTGGAFLNANTVVSCSWDMKVMLWQV